MKLNKSIVAAAILVGLGLAACNSGGKRRNPGKTYAPDMTYSRAYDAYTGIDTGIFADGQASRPPVPGTVARGHELPDHLVEGDSNAYRTMTTAMRFNEAEMAEGKRLFNIYCGVCHGTNLDGQGPLFTSNKYAAMPANFKDGKYLHMPVGQMYAAIKFGKNMMGSYASQLDVKQRWMVIAYIKKVQSENGGDAFAFGSGSAPATDTTATAAPAADAAGHDAAAAHAAGEQHTNH